MPAGWFGWAPFDNLGAGTTGAGDTSRNARKLQDCATLETSALLLSGCCRNKLQLARVKLGQLIPKLRDDLYASLKPGQLIPKLRDGPYASRQTIFGDVFSGNAGAQATLRTLEPVM